MTDNTELRTLLKDLLGTDLHESCGPECADKELFEEKIATIEAWKDAACTEARIDELEGLLKTTYMHIFNESVVEVALVEKRLRLLNTQEETHE